MKSLLEALRRVVIFPAVLIMGFLPAGNALAAYELNLAIAANGPVAPGQNVAYIITASNTGDAGTGGLTLSATVPDNTTVPPDQDEGANCSGGISDCLAGQTLSWSINLDVGESLTRAFTAVVDGTSPPSDGTLITSTASTSLGLSVDASVTVWSAAGLNLSLDATPNTAPAGDEYLYKLTYSNAGTSTVDSDLSFSLPAGAIITSASNGGVIIGDTATWSIGNLSGGASGTRYVHAQIPGATATGTLVLAGAQLSDSDGIAQTATANTIITVDTPLELGVSVTPDPVQPGQNVSYVITVSNTSVSATGAMTLYARVPNHTTVPPDQDENGNCSGGNSDCLAGQSLYWSVNLGAGESLTRTFTAVVDDTTPPANGTLLGTVVSLFGTTGTDNTGAAVTAEAVVGDAGPMLALDAPPGRVAAGGSYTYTLTYGNGGASTVNAELTLRLPLGTTFQSATGGGTFAGGVVSWDVGALAPGQVDRQQVTLQAPAAPTGSLLIAAAQLRDPVTLQSHARAGALVTVDTPLELGVSVTPDPVQPGQNVSYVITVSNTSVSATGAMTLYARVPNHTTVPPDQDENGNCSGGNSDCLAGQSLYWSVNLGAGESLTRTFTAVVDDTTPPANGTLLGTVVNLFGTTGTDNTGAAVTAEAVVGSDTDGDGVVDPSDNCTEIANPDQRDTDSDGYGNLCDADFDNTGFVNFADLAYFKTQFGTTDPDADFDGNGFVNFADLATFKTLFGKAPGPSGLAP